MRLCDIIPPHHPDDATKLATLTAAYGAGETVPPVVVVTLDGEARALCGSHRIAAMLAVFDEDAEIAEDDADVIQVEGEELLAALETIAEDDDHDHNLDASRALQDLERLTNNRSVDFGDLCSSLIACGVLPDRAAAALEDQQ